MQLTWNYKTIVLARRLLPSFFRPFFCVFNWPVLVDTLRQSKKRPLFAGCACAAFLTFIVAVLPARPSITPQCVFHYTVAFFRNRKILRNTRVWGKLSPSKAVSHVDFLMSFDAVLRTPIGSRILLPSPYVSISRSATRSRSDSATLPTWYYCFFLIIIHSMSPMLLRSYVL